MRFLSDAESRQWVAERQVSIDDRGRPAAYSANHHHLQFQLPASIGQFTALCRFLGSCLEPRASCLLWITEWGVWPSAENWHLYYRLRESHGDRRLLNEAPGHLLLIYEEAELVSFVEIGLLAGWDIHLIPHLTYGDTDTARVFISHDGWIILSHREESTVATWRTELQQRKYRLLSIPTG